MPPLRARVDLGVMGNEGALCIPQSSSITGTSPSDCLVSYPGHSLGESYPSAEVQLVYSTATPTRRLGNDGDKLITISKDDTVESWNENYFEVPIDLLRKLKQNEIETDCT